jgi:hypothetical protein
MAATEAPVREAAPGQPGRPAEEPEPQEPEERQEEQPEEPTPDTQEGEDEDGGGKPPKPPDLNELLDKADAATLRKHPRLAGIIGEQAKREATRLAQQRADELVREREERFRAEQSRQAVLAKARQGDYYAIGEQAARDALKQDQDAAVTTFTRQAEAKTYERMQSVLEDWATTQPEGVAQAAAERMGELPQDVTWEQGFRKWLDAYVEVKAEHLAANPDAKRKVEREVTPAVRQRVLAEMNGKEPTADGGSGRAQRTRTITDEDIARMSLEDYMTVWDVDKGRPKPGVVYKPTRAIDPRSMQLGGRGI